MNAELVKLLSQIKPDQPSVTETSANITRLLGDWSRGDAAALEKLLPSVHAE